MHRLRVAGCVQEAYKTSSPVNLVFLEPSILLKEKPSFENEHALNDEWAMQSWLAKKFPHCKQHRTVSDIIPVLP